MDGILNLCVKFFSLIHDSTLTHLHVFEQNVSGSYSVPWPPRSPDMSSCDYFLWGYLKGRVYTHKPRNLGELKDPILQDVLTIDQQLLAQAMDDFKRIENCIQEVGRHLNDIIFHT